MSVEFEIKQDALAVIKNTVIDGNFDEVKAALTEMVAPYKSMVVSEDAISGAKADRANLRKVSARIDEVRKTVKKTYSEPLAVFEGKCKELMSIISDGAENLDRQIKDFEQREAEEKIEQLHAEYIAMTDDEMESFLPWGAINNPKWANKTYSSETALQEIRDAIENTRNDLTTIRSMGGDDTPYLLDVYRQTRDLSAVVRKASELKTMRQREEQRARDEAFRRQEEIRRRQEAERMEAEKAHERIAEAAHAPVVESAAEDLVTVSFKVTCTRDQLTALGEYMKKNGIKYGKA